MRIYHNYWIRALEMMEFSIPFNFAERLNQQVTMVTLNWMLVDFILYRVLTFFKSLVPKGLQQPTNPWKKDLMWNGTIRRKKGVVGDVWLCSLLVFTTLLNEANHGATLWILVEATPFLLQRNKIYCFYNNKRIIFFIFLTNVLRGYLEIFLTISIQPVQPAYCQTNWVM